MTVPSTRDDAGISIVELIIVLAVSTVLVSLVAVMFASSLTAQRETTERDAATVQLNAVTASITESVRASTDARVSDAGRRLDAKILLSDGETWECRAWQLSGDELRYSTGTTPRQAADSTWALIASNVGGTLTGGAAFEKSGTRVSLGLEIARGTAGAAVSDGTNSQVVHEGGVACW